MEAQLHRDHDDLHPSDVHVKEEHGTETRSVMKKVKEKVDILKAKVKHGQDEAQTVNDSPVVKSGLVEPTVMGTPVLAEDLYATHSDIVDVPVRTFAQWEDEERHHAPPPLSTDYGTRRTDHGPHVGDHSYGQDANREEQFEHIAPLPVSTGYDHTRVTSDVPRVGHQTYDQKVNRERLKGGVVPPVGLEEEGRHEASPQRSTGYQTHRTDAPRGSTNTGGEEVGITGVLKSFDKTKVYDEPDTKSSQSEQPESKVYKFAPEPEPVESPPVDTITDNPSHPNSSYTQRISSATSAIVDKAAALKDTVVSKLSSSGENKTEGDTATHKASTKSSFPTEFSHKVADTLSSTLGPVYETVGGSVMSIMHDETTGGSGVRVKEYLVDTFKPGDDDKVLSEVITHALHLGKRNQQPQETSTTTTYVVSDEGERRVEDSSN